MALLIGLVGLAIGILWAMNSIERTAKLILDAGGTLKGDVKEVRLGGRAWQQRGAT